MKIKFLYPQKFSVNYKTEEELKIAGAIWTKSLADIYDNTIVRALDECIDKFTWPPEIAEFRQLCKAIQGDSRLQYADKVLSYQREKVTHSNLNVQRIIDEGAAICKKLKDIYPDLTWFQIADKFSLLKKKQNITIQELMI